MSAPQRHLFHMVNPSPWPLVAAFSVFSLMVGSVMYFHGYSGGTFLMPLGFIVLVSTMVVWWRDVIREATFEGHHTSVVQRGLRYGMILFILSEVMFFFGFFWAYFHASLAPTVELGAVWPPVGIHVFDPWGVPFLNTLILLTSGATTTWAHHSIVHGNYKEGSYAFQATLVLAALFTALQAKEYLEANFSIADGIYGTTFYMATGFHGCHVIIGTLFLAVCYVRFLRGHFTKTHHFGFEAAAWYWHFVDVVWLFLFAAVYWWGSL